MVSYLSIVLKVVNVSFVTCIYRLTFYFIKSRISISCMTHFCIQLQPQPINYVSVLNQFNIHVH